MQLDKDTYISTGQILNQSPKFKKCPVPEKIHIYIIPNRMRSLHSYTKILSYTVGRSKIMVLISRTLRRHNMPQLQNLFRQRYSKLGNTCEQLFHVWRSFTFNENTETIDSYVIRIRQAATPLDYGEPQILEVFKKTLPTKLYWILDLIHAVETAKRILTKEKLDKQLTGQTSTSPFMSVREETDRRVLFNTREELGTR